MGSQLQRHRALVLFRYSRQRGIDEEPVYNTTVAWPDDAPNHPRPDLGEQNVKLFDYYGKFQPDREVSSLMKPRANSPALERRGSWQDSSQTSGTIAIMMS